MTATGRVASLARAEAVLLRRNRAALGSAVLAPLPVALVLFTNSTNSEVPGQMGAVSVGALLVIGLIVFTLMLGVYYNLVTALVARREEFVLKRLRTGEIEDVEIIVATAAPVVVIAWAQVGFGVAVGFAFLDLEIPVNPVLALVGVVLGTALCALLAAAVAMVTSSVEMAQLTATPLLVLSLTFSGAMIPLETLPERLSGLAQAVPLTPVVDLVRLGLTGTTPAGDVVGLGGSFTAAVRPIVILGVWLTVGGWLVRGRFRWEPRR
jgi:ABC-2 type transport system permease protein